MSLKRGEREFLKLCWKVHSIIRLIKRRNRFKLLKFYEAKTLWAKFFMSIFNTLNTFLIMFLSPKFSPSKFFFFSFLMERNSLLFIAKAIKSKNEIIWSFKSVKKLKGAVNFFWNIFPFFSDVSKARTLHFLQWQTVAYSGSALTLDVSHRFCKIFKDLSRTKRFSFLVVD